MKFIARFGISIVVGYVLGLVIALAASGWSIASVGQLPAFTVPFGIVIAYVASFLVVRPG